jgi:hypothetical protein
MSARRLASSSRKDLEALRYQGIAAADGYAQIQALATSLSPEHALLFAEPMHDASAGTTDWYTSAPGEIRSFNTLSSAEKEWTRSRVAELAGGINTVAEQLKNSNEGPKVIRGNVLALALRFPDASHIYLVGSQPVVTCWGFVPAHAGVTPEDMIRAGAARPAAPVPPLTPPPAPEPETPNAPVVVPVTPAATCFAWWKALLYILLGLLLLAGLIVGVFLLFGPNMPEYLQKYAPGCAEKQPEATNVQVPPEILAALNNERKQEDDLRKEIEHLRNKLVDRAAMCVREAPKPPVIEEPKPEPVVETPPAEEPQAEEPPLVADLLPSTPEPQEEPPMVAELLPSTPEPPQEEPKPQPKPEPKLEPKPKPTPEAKPEPQPEPEPKPAPKPHKGDPLVIPPGARENNDLSFLEGCWKSETGLVDWDEYKPIDVRYCFDTNGRGTREVKMENGTRCIGPLRARFDPNGKLRMNADSAPCDRGSFFEPEQVECTQGAGGKADCDGKALGGKRLSWKNAFRRSE